MRPENVVLDSAEVVIVELKLMGTGCNKVGGRKRLHEAGDEESGERDVKRKKGLDLMCHVEG